jgi:hypothetical protein
VTRRERRPFEVFSLSFLDCICCGFGAIILLFVLNKMGEPAALERSRQDLSRLLARLEQELYEIRGETSVLNRDLRGREAQLSLDRQKLARLQGDLSSVQGQYQASRELSSVQDIIAGRLLAGAPVGGIPVDSEYVVFVIDTSGSMQRFAWPAVQRKMAEVLDAYPKLRGIQVMSDMGSYMFSSYAGKWIPDTPARRAAIRERLRSWNPYSNSSPVEGIEAAIRSFWSSERKISIYVFGDEFTGESIDDVLREIDRLNRADPAGQRKVRIHAIGFPTLFDQSQYPERTQIRFATLMRLVCERNGGAFVALNSLAP